MEASALIGLGLTVADWLQTNIPKWIDRAKAKGELTAEQEAEFQQRQKEIFSRDYAQPSGD